MVVLADFEIGHKRRGFHGSGWGLRTDENSRRFESLAYLLCSEPAARIIIPILFIWHVILSDGKNLKSYGQITAMKIHKFRFLAAAAGSE
ncbi:MAG: hypothetical protein BZY88_10730 [SAR202 cluster bacterium Io17-Chloro-G9]|nr:MAG: hypothetical protein BZY88_10730 [SAR202 cluster bacterium Io17-Chloro-G9]